MKYLNKNKLIRDILGHNGLKQPQNNEYFYSDKCNTEMNCIDKSDEYYCDYLRFGENYASGKKILLS